MLKCLLLTTLLIMETVSLSTALLEEDLVLCMCGYGMAQNVCALTAVQWLWALSLMFKVIISLTSPCRSHDCCYYPFPGIIESNSNILVTNQSMLTISSVNATEDGAMYECVAINDAGFGVARSVVYVRPLIVEHPQDLLTSDGENFTLSCRAESFPYPQYHWEKYNTTSQTYKPLLGERSSLLEFTEVQFNDHGVYRCVATAPVINAVAYSNNYTVTGECIDPVAIS